MISGRISVEAIKELVDMIPGLGWAAWPNGKNLICQVCPWRRTPDFQIRRSEHESFEGKFSWSELVHGDDYRDLEVAWLLAVGNGDVYKRCT